MNTTSPNWLEQIRSANTTFQAQITPDKLPTARQPGSVVITCMDPRVNLEAIGIPAFGVDGEGKSPTRIIRTLGAMADNRSLIVGIFLAGFREAVVLMHTDCGCCMAYSKIDVIIANMQRQLSSEAFQQFKAQISEPFEDNLRAYLKAFEDPYQAIQQEVQAIKRMPFIPADFVVHGLVYELSTGTIKVVVNGYDALAG